ncbi:hypothetical protein Gohar_021857, partial [Gossypium harknessii]|nr:hypothetical protein [Gossypium harknessii]
ADNWILGFNHYLGRCSPLEAELWDNLEVVSALSMEESMESSITLFRRVKRILRFAGQWKIKYVSRECNLIANQLTKINLS